jgi:tRNA(adenine34) deaminase
MEAKEHYMKQALKEAQKAYKKGEAPIGAVVVKEGKIIARAHNLREKNNDPTAHAEILALRKAAKKLGEWRLLGCDMYVTLEPCPMCAGAIIQARIERLYAGAMDLKAEAAGSVVDLFSETRFNHKVEVETGLLAEECSNILKVFFKELRDGNI